jgi:SAM-dependent methyltransferase
VWASQGRSPELVQYFAALINEFSPRRVLEVGCGEGAFLAALSAPQKHGTDLSALALEKAAARTNAQLSIALGECLPFPDEYFDLIASVGVMEHFIDVRLATREIWRTLVPRGHYVLLIHADMTLWQSFRQKVAENLFPIPTPSNFRSG